MKIADHIVPQTETEKSQASARVVIIGLATVYLSVNAVMGGAERASAWQSLTIGVSYLVFSLLLLGSIRVWGEPNVVRRGLGVVADLGVLSYVLHITGPSGAALYPLYLWVIVGNGMRFGVRYLLAATVIGVVGFLLVITTTVFWLQNIPIAGGLLIGLIVLPLFYSSLLRRLHESNRRLARQMQESHHSATHDTLTGLPNRSQFMHLLNGAVERAERGGQRIGVMFIDLDRFKVVNDSLGHEAGDQVLREAARRLLSSVRSVDTVCRISGDEFTVILEDLGSGEEAAWVAERVIEHFAEPMLISQRSLIVSTSIGIAIFPSDTHRATDLIEDADAAMYKAKESGRNRYVFYTRELNAQAQERLELEMDLRKALQNDEFLLYYQPRISAADNKVVGVEALLRWQHPQRGLLQPDQFIPLLEQMGLIVPAGEQVIRQACEQCKVWHRQGRNKLSVSVNVSSKQLHAHSLVSSVRQALIDSGLDPRYLELELSEGVLADDTGPAAGLLQELQQIGVTLSIDDFGSGYSSLSYLMHLPIERLKIDRSFIRDVTVNPDHASLTTAITAMAKSLRMRIVAEGVETVEQLEFLTSLGCDEMQGELIGEPVAPQQVEAAIDRADKRLSQLEHERMKLG